jgi:hypothetical protein
MATSVSSSTTTAGRDDDQNLWSVLLSETSKKAKILDASVIFVGKHKPTTNLLSSAFSKGPQDKSNAPSGAGFDFIEAYSFCEIEDGYSDAELGKVNVWNLDESALLDGFEVACANHTMSKVNVSVSFKIK